MKRFVVLILVAFALLLPLSGAKAQTYSFIVESEKIDVFWELDGSLSLFYEITFQNFADPIDFVDIGLPNNNYNLSNVQAWADGKPITNIEDSPYVTYGPALGLGANAIPSGQRGIVHVQVTGITGVLFTDEEDETYASAVFSPNFFGSEFVSGSSDITLVYHLPPGVDPAEPRWHPAPSGFPDQPETGFDSEGRITYAWRNSSASASSFYLFGASFPQSYVPAGTVSQPSAVDFGNISDGLFNIDTDAVIGFIIFACVCLFFIGITWIAVVADRRQKMRYLPPKIAIEGNGIKRGLTAPEAAILLEQPMDKIFTMILFSVIRKDSASVTKRDPLALDVVDPLPPKLREYEILFLNAFKEKGKVKRRKALQKLMVKLVKSVANKMKGFSKRETVAYYESIVAEAWQQVDSADTPEVKSEKFEEELEWTMLDKDYDRRTRDVFHGPVFVPQWWGRYDPGFGRSSTIGSAGKSTGSVPNLSTGSGKVSLPSLPGGDFAASMVTGVQNLSAGVLGSLSDFTGGVTKVTNPPPKATSRSSGGWSGGGSSCACACAGCACACAGGGR